jgi:hypothetical protein
MDDAMKEVILQPIHQAFRELVNAGFFRWVISNRQIAPGGAEVASQPAGNLDQLLQEAQDKTTHLLDEIKQSTHSSTDVHSVVESIQQNLVAILSLPTFQNKHPLLHSRKYQQAMKYLHAGNLKSSPWITGDTYTWSVVLGWMCILQLGKMITNDAYEEISRSWMDEWMLNKIFVSTLNDLGLDDRSNWRAVILVKLLTSHHAWWSKIAVIPDKKRRSVEYLALTSILSDGDALGYLGVNRYQDVLWFNKEAFEDLMWWLYVIAAIEVSVVAGSDQRADESGKSILRCYNTISSILVNAQASGYKLEKLLDLMK